MELKDGPLRVLPLREFFKTLAAIYFVQEKEVSVIAIQHGRRHPRHWQGRRATADG